MGSGRAPASRHDPRHENRSRAGRRCHAGPGPGRVHESLDQPRGRPRHGDRGAAARSRQRRRPLAQPRTVAGVLGISASDRAAPAGSDALQPPPRLPGATDGSPLPPGLLRRFRRPLAQRRARGAPAVRRCGGRRVRTSLPRALADPADAARRPLPRARRAFDGRQQHLCLQLPARRRKRPLVRPRVWHGHRSQPDAEPVRDRVVDSPASRCAFREDRSLRDRATPSRRCDPRRRHRGPVVRSNWLGVGRQLGCPPGLPALLREGS